jgi:S1-C subfamily serine protease
VSFARRTGRPGLAAGAASLTLALGVAACGGDEETSTSGDPVSANGGTPTVAINTAIPGFDAQRLYEEDAQSVVTILSIFGDPESAIAEAQAGQGSGFVINTEGEIVTNAHVVTDATETGAQSVEDINQADEVFVEFDDRNQVPAEIIGFDPDADIALIKVDPAELDLEPIEFGDSGSVAVGTPVAAIGSPFGQEQSISTGIVSATDRSIESLTQFRIDGAIQTDASINPGNSGGPLIDASGRVIGVNQQINTTSGGNEGVGFAIPADLVQRSVDDLRDDGTAEYAYIGVRSQPLYPQLAEELGIEAPTGSLISSVVPDGPADQAGLQGSDEGPDARIQFQGRPVRTGGDTVVAVDGTELVGENDLSRLIAQKRPGDTVTLTIIRDGEEQEVEVELGARPTG